MYALLVDFGSTFTKVRVVDIETGELRGTSQAPTTVDSDVTIGLRAALGELPDEIRAAGFDDHLRVACSSAAGGLRIVAVGLIKELTTEAAVRAALGAGGRVVATMAGGLSRSDVAEIAALEVDLIVLSGGTDGGNTACIVSSARRLAAAIISCPVVVAGNRLTQDEVIEILRAAGKTAVPVANVLPTIGELRVEGCRSAIRSIFLDRIVHAKGLDRAEEFIGRVAMPTPEAVLLGCTILAETLAADGEHETVVAVDIGGATTDVYSVGSGAPTEGGAVLKGLPEPYVKRTVEGDLGLRINATSIGELVGEERIRESFGLDLDIAAEVAALHKKPDTIPTQAPLRELDVALAHWATYVGVRRHAGTREVVYGSMGPTVVQIGKDLREAATVVGTGGIFGSATHDAALRILTAATQDDPSSASLVPASPNFFVDATYSLFAAGLLASVDRNVATRFMRETVVRPASSLGETSPAIG